MPEFAPTIDLSTLDGTTGFQINGEAGFDSSGRPVSSAGDINGDGFADLIIGAPFASPNGLSSSGASYVVFGQASGFGADLDLSALGGSNGFQINGKAANDQSGYSVSGAGDVNGDGFDDLIIGARFAGHRSEGASYVLFGQASGFAANLDLSALDGANGFKIRGEVSFRFSGSSVSGAGDVNSDGFDDLLIGAPGYAVSSAGASYVVFGKAGGFTSLVKLSTLDGGTGFEIIGVGGHDNSGASVSDAGDVNGDGFADLLIGAVGAGPSGSLSGAIYVVFGKALGFGATLDLSSLDGSNGFQINGEAAFDYSGRSVSGAGDVNGDGFDDIIISADGGDPGGDSRAGESYVVFGKTGGFATTFDVSTLDGTNGFRLDGIDINDSSGRSVSSAGDVNGDGFDDLIISAPYADPHGTYSGASYVVFGRAEGFAAHIDLSTLDGSAGFQINGEAEFDRSGLSVSGAGDVNGDGFADLLIGTPYADPHGDRSGASYVIFGHRAFEAVTRIGTDLGQTINGGFGDDTISGLGGGDRLIGWEGRDTILGGAGRDTLIGGAGKDILTGGQGPDAFDFNNLSESGLTKGTRDIIRDFHPGADLIDLADIDALPGGGDDAFDFIGTAAFTAEGQVRVEQNGAHTRVEINKLGADGADMAITLLNVTASALTEVDFVL